MGRRKNHCPQQRLKQLARNKLIQNGMVKRSSCGTHLQQHEGGLTNHY